MAVRATAVVMDGNLDTVADGTNASAQAPASFLIKAPSTNAAVIYLGGSDLTPGNKTTHGYPLAAGDPAIGIDLFGGDILSAVGTANDKLIVLKTRS